MIHLYSFKLTHTKNTIWRRARDGASDVIHAEGVRDDFPSSAPKARNPLTSHGEAACAGERIDRRRAAASPHSICCAAKKRSCPAAKRHPTGRGGGSLLASKVGSFLPSAEARRRRGHNPTLAAALPGGESP
jgi:hypothetical protein